jgi:hypothetical protein
MASAETQLTPMMTQYRGIKAELPKERVRQPEATLSMKSAKKIKTNELIRLFTPLINLRENHCSLWQLNKEAAAIVEKTKITGVPSVLKLKNGKLAIICDPSTYSEVERRRLQLVQSLEDIPSRISFVPRVAKLSEMSATFKNSDRTQKIKSCVGRIEHLRQQVNLLKCRLYDQEEQLAEEERKLSRLSETI